MPRRSDTLVIVPAFNEEASVAAVVTELFASAPGLDCLVVDDGSSDATSAVARAARATVVTLPFNLGVGGAMRTGFHYAVQQGYSNAVQLDADGQHDPSLIPALLDALTAADIVIGARFAGVGEYEARGPRRWAMRAFAFVLSRITGARLTDTTSGFKAIGPKALRLFAVNYPAEYLGDTLEALVVAARSGCHVTQIPVSMRSRSGGTPSHNPWKSALYLGRATMALFFALIRPGVKPTGAPTA